MEQKIVIIAAGGAAAAAIVLFLVLGQGAMRGLFPSTLASANLNATAPRDLGIIVKNVTVSRQDKNTANVLVVFQVTNPNPTTALLENVHYNVSIGNYQMTSGDTGEVLEGFYGSQATTIPVVPMGNVTIKNDQISTRNNLTSSSWNSMVEGTAKYTIDGWYAVRTTSSLETSYQEKDFLITYP